MVTNTRRSALNWCFSTLGCPHFTLWDTLSLAFGYEFDLIEIRALEGRVDLPRYLTEVFGDPSRLGQIIEGGHVRIASLDTSARLLGCPEVAKRELSDYAAWADVLKVPYLRVFDGGRSIELDDAQLSEMIEFLGWWRSLRASNDWKVDLMVETHDSLCDVGNIDRLQSTLADEPVKLLWDSHHTWRKMGVDPLDTWESIREYVAHVHFKDSIDVPGEKLPFTYVGLGMGQFPLLRLFEALEKDQFDGPVSLEWERQWHPSLGPLEEQLAKVCEGTFL